VLYTRLSFHYTFCRRLRQERARSEESRVL